MVAGVQCGMLALGISGHRSVQLTRKMVPEVQCGMLALQYGPSDDTVWLHHQVPELPLRPDVATQIEPCKGWCQTLQFWQRTQADDLGLRWLQQDTEHAGKLTCG